jgi:DNA replication licensing factor MCM5
VPLASAALPAATQARQAKASAEGEDSPIPMTVRQLEALIRISESFARMSLAAEADDGHVAAAFDLFTKSTINAMNAGLINSTERLEVGMGLVCNAT